MFNLIVLLVMLFGPAQCFKDYLKNSAVLGEVARGYKEGDLSQLRPLLKAVTGREPAAYNNYGCHCGQRGGQNIPAVDGVDRCCKEHDECYANLPECQNREVEYFYQCQANKKCRCISFLRSCNGKVCKCDLELANCLSREFYDYYYVNFQKKYCKKF
ncbi:basic phospholipase A2 homolog textilotoxin B chain-like [Physella acuta]|uniref:basic phospholipase A2 homolog textilotoxin B chain-like n=1 Tax=Physella acuta TaxID=109671 RepID=UPI0027DCDD5F|nr:basic phospholipase A2 homolog textilotoxin B chain-like [Physella acuta]